MGHHDLFFKKTFSIREHAKDYLRHVLPPELAEGIDYATVAFEKDSHVDAKLAECFSDTVYSCRFFGTDLKIALLFEHKSRPDDNLPFQLHRYMSNLWKNSAGQKLPRMPVIPVVLYHGKTKWNPGLLSSRFQDLPDPVRPFVPDSEYVFVNLADYSNEFIEDRLFTMASLRIAMLIMKNIFDQDMLERHIREFFELGRSIFEEKQGLKFLESVVIYLYRATDIDTETVVNSISEISAKGGELAMSTAERLRQEGKREGRKESILSLIRNAKKQGISEEKIAKIVNLDIGLIDKILNHEDVEVPLHLLDSIDNR